MATRPRATHPLWWRWASLFFLWWFPTTVTAKGNELASLSNPPLTDLSNHSHRQDICSRYSQFSHGQVDLRDALSGMKLQPLMAMGKFFRYDPITGIDPDDPGLMADLMDLLAESANFTWRQSFAVMEDPEVLNQTWTNMLLWGIEHYDIAVNWWDHSLARMEKGAAFIVPWFDGSLILVDQSDPPVDVREIVWFNWLSPFETSVWVLVVFTIFASSLVYQLIEHIHHDREDRPWFQWFSDNLYLSALNFTQNFQYAPNTVAGRIFSFSMAMWALVMTATYTANLASLFVQDQRPALVVDSIEQAVQLKIPICTMALTNSDSIIQGRYPQAIRKPKATEWQMYDALRRGECGLVAAYKDNWLGYQGNSQYNPDCDLEWVGRVVEFIKSGFATKADAGELCTSLIRDVLNLHMTELIAKGQLDEVWDKHRSKTRDNDCEVDTEDQRRRLRATTTTKPRRSLKAGNGAATASSDTTDGTASLTVTQMLGTFALHWASMIIALVISVIAQYYEDRNQKTFDPDNEMETEVVEVINRTHGPIIGPPPKPNTKMSIRTFDLNREFGTDHELFDSSQDSQERRRFEADNGRRGRRRTTTLIHKNYANGSTHWPQNYHYIRRPTLAATREQSRRPKRYQRDCDDEEEMEEQSPKEEEEEEEWKSSYSELQQRQQDLSAQMSTVLTLLQEMREEQKGLIRNQRQYLEQHGDWVEDKA